MRATEIYVQNAFVIRTTYSVRAAKMLCAQMFDTRRKVSGHKTVVNIFGDQLSSYLVGLGDSFVTIEGLESTSQHRIRTEYTVRRDEIHHEGKRRKKDRKDGRVGVRHPNFDDLEVVAKDMDGVNGTDVIGGHRVGNMVM
jgi:hypothetical protein